MPAVPLPAFGGLSFFAAVAQQQRQARGSLLPVPQHAEAVDSHAGQDAREKAADAATHQQSDDCGSWLSGTVQLSFDMGLEHRPLGSVAAEGRRSKAEQAIIKRCWAVLGQEVQPAIKPVAPAVPASKRSTDRAADSCSTVKVRQQPQLAAVTASFVSSFSRCSSSSSTELGVGNSAIHTGAADGSTSHLTVVAASLLLDQPVTPATETAFGAEAYMQGPTVLFCEPQELQQLWACISDDIPAECLDATAIKMCRVPSPADNTSSATQVDAAFPAADSTQPTGAAPAIGPSVQQLLQKWVVRQQRQVLFSPHQTSTLQAATDPQGAQSSAQLPTTAAVANTGSAATATDPTEGNAASAVGDEHGGTLSAPQDAETAAASDTALTDSPTGADPLPQLPDASSEHPAAAAAAATAEQHFGVLPKLPPSRDTTLDEPILQTSFLTVAEGTACTATPCPLSSLACITSIATAEQAGYINSTLAGGLQDTASGAAAGSSGIATGADINSACPPNMRRFQLPVLVAEPAVSTAQQQQQAAADLLVPASAVPVLMSVPVMGSSGSKAAHSLENDSVTTNRDSAGMQPNAAQIMRNLLAGLPMPQASSRRRQSVVGRQAAKHIPHPSMQCKTKSAAVTPITAGAAATAVQEPQAAEDTTTGAAGASEHSKPTTEQQGRCADADMTQAAAPSEPETMTKAQQQQQRQGLNHSQQEAGLAPNGSQSQEDSLSGQLSPDNLLVEVPVYLPDQPTESLNAQLLTAALSAAQAVLKLSPDRWLGEAGAVSATTAGPIAAGQCSTATMPVWDATWGDLELQDAGLSTVHTTGLSSGLSSSAATAAGWCNPAVLAMLSGAALEAPDNPAAGHAVQGAIAGQQGRQLAACVQPSELPLLGSYLLEQMVAADMQLGQDSTDMLPVVLFPEADEYCVTDAAGSSAGCRPHAGVCAELLAQCGIKRQSTAHLELYFDWTLLQAPQQLLSSRHSKRGSSSLPSTAAAKRLKTLGGGVAEMHGRQQQPEQQDTSALLQLVLQHESLRQLQQDLGKKPAVPAAPPGANQSSTSWNAQKLAAWHSRQAIAAYMQQGSTKTAASILPLHSSSLQLVHIPVAAADELSENPIGSDQVLSVVSEVVPSAVAAAAAAWHVKHTQAAVAKSKPGTTTVTPSVKGAAAPAAAGVAPPSDLDFFMQLQGAGQQQRNKRRHSLKVSAQAVQDGEAERLALTEQRQGGTGQAALRDAQQVSLSPAGPSAKRPRVSAVQQQQMGRQQDGAQHAGAHPEADHELDLTRCQQQQATALATADRALNGVNRGVAADLGASEDAAAAAGPTVVTSAVSPTMLKLLLQLDGMRHTVLSTMECPGPGLVESLLWQDAAAQHVLLQHKAQQQKQQQQSGQGPSLQQKQRNKQLVVVVLLSQTAACLLHYGIRVAHMFLQHGLQRLPSVCEACKPALAALSKANDAIEQQPRTAAGSGTHSSTEVSAAEHPKLAQLQNLVLRLKAKQPDCKLLVVAEAKAFFNLYHTLSAAGVLAVQLDRNKNLPMGPAGGGSSSADPAAVAAWQSAVSLALGAASCVLATHEQLHNPCMVLQDFHVLIEYVAWEATAARQAAAAGAGGMGVTAGSSSAAVSVQFGPGRHFVFAVQEPDLEQSAVEAQKARQPATASPTVSAGAASAAHSGYFGTVEAPGGVRHEVAAAAHAGAPQPPAAASVTPIHAAAAQDAGAVLPADSEATAEVPLVLNASGGSVVKRRQSLYRSLMQLEDQGFVLVERGLCNSSRGNTGAAALVGLAVDIVLTPQACLCVWDDSKLPQDPEAALQALSRTILALSMSYSCAYFLLELGNGLLQHILHNSSNLQGLARAAGVKLQLLVCFSAANTQDAVLHTCKAATSCFWSAFGGSSSTTSSSSSSGMQPPQGMVDVPTPAEFELSSCCALNPLSAAVLASHGATLRGLFEAAMTEDGLQHDLLRACLPAKSLQLLQVQASAVADRIQQQQQQEQQELLAAATAEDEQLLLQQQSQGQHYHGQHQDMEGLQQSEGYHNACAPSTHAMPGSDTWGAPPSRRPQQQLQQQQWMGMQQEQQEPEMAHVGQGHMWNATNPTDDWQDGSEQYIGQRSHHLQQQQQWIESPHNRSHPGAQQQASKWQQQQQQQQLSGRAAELLPDLGLDPSAVLDDFLSGRAPGVASGNTTRRLPGASVHTAAGGMQQAQSYIPQQQQQQRARRAPARHVPQMQQQQCDLQDEDHLHDADLQGMQLEGSGRPGPTWHSGVAGGLRASPMGNASRARGVMPPSEPWAAAELEDDTEFAGPDPGVRQAEVMDLRHELGPAFGDEGLDPIGLPGGRQGQYARDPGGWNELQGYDDFDGRQVLYQGRPGGSSRAPAMIPDPDFGAEMFGDMRDGPKAMLQQGSSHRSNRQQQQQQYRGMQGQMGNGPGHTSNTGIGGLGGMGGMGGMFSAAKPRGARVTQLQELQEDADFFDAAPAPPRHSNARPPAAANAGAAGFRQGVTQGHRAHISTSTDGARGWGAKSIQMQPVRRGFTGGPAASNTSSRLSVPAFMPHHNPSKQLKYRLPVGAGVAKRKRPGKGGLQSKLCWG